MSNIYLLVLLALLAGAAAPFQGTVNNRMAEVLSDPILASFISFAVGALTLLIYILASGTPLSGFAAGRNAPAIAWTGGVLGVFFVVATLVLIPRLGVAMTFALVTAGQMIFTLVIDHYGLLGVPVREISLMRVGGIVLITAGVVLIRKF